MSDVTRTALIETITSALDPYIVERYGAAPGQIRVDGWIDLGVLADAIMETHDVGDALAEKLGYVLLVEKSCTDQPEPHRHLAYATVWTERAIAEDRLADEVLLAEDAGRYAGGFKLGAVWPVSDA